MDALHHFSDQKGAIEALIRFLKPGGRMLIEEPNIHFIPVKMVALMEKMALMKSHFHTPEEIKSMVMRDGVDVRVTQDENFAVWIIVEKTSD